MALSSRTSASSRGTVSIVHPRDIILQIDGFDIDTEGNYHDPQYKKLCLENLSSRGKWAGMECKLKILRDGKEQVIDYKLPKAEYTDELLPSQAIRSGPRIRPRRRVSFSCRSASLICAAGVPNWRQRAPFRLAYYSMDKVRPERPPAGRPFPRCLPHPANIGYEGLRNLVVDEINGNEDQADFGRRDRAQIADRRLRCLSNSNRVRRSGRRSSMPRTSTRRTRPSWPHYHIPADHVLNTPAAPVVQKVIGAVARRAPAPARGPAPATFDGPLDISVPSP